MGRRLAFLSTELRGPPSQQSLRAGRALPGMRDGDSGGGTAMSDEPKKPQIIDYPTPRQAEREVSGPSFRLRPIRETSWIRLSIALGLIAAFLLFCYCYSWL